MTFQELCDKWNLTWDDWCWHDPLSTIQVTASSAEYHFSIADDPGELRFTAEPNDADRILHHFVWLPR